MARTIEDSSKDDFKEFFCVRCTDTDVTPLAALYTQALDKFIEQLWGITKPDSANTTRDAEALANAKVPLRTAIVKRLREDAERFCATPQTLDPPEGLRRVGVAKGRFSVEAERLERSLFVVSPKRDEAGKAVDLAFRVNSGGINDAVPPEKQTLFMDMSNALTVINACCDRLQSDAPVRAADLRDEFISKLAALGSVGLTGTHPALAQTALPTLKAEFFARNAGAIKKRANTALAKWAFGAAFILAIPYFVCRWFYELPGSLICDRREYFLLSAGAAVGTWLSFSIRNLDLTFDDLGKFEDEFLGPWVRVAFVVALSLIVGLMFWTGAFSISVGKMQVVPHISGGTAILVGVFCGLSERGLASAVSSRAAGFIRGITGANSS